MKEFYKTIISVFAGMLLFEVLNFICNLIQK